MKPLLLVAAVAVASGAGAGESQKPVDNRPKVIWNRNGPLGETPRHVTDANPLFLIFDSETMPDWFGMPDDNDLPSTFSIEYVRAWKQNG